MKIVECPICDSKFNIERVPDGTKLKCGKCKKVFGIVQGSELMPILEEAAPVAAPPPPTRPVARKPTPRRPVAPPVEEPYYAEEEIPEEEYEEVQARPTRDQTRGRVSSRMMRREVSSYRERREVKKAEKPSLVLVLGGLLGLVAMGTLIYVWHTIQQPLPPRLSEKPPEKSSSKEPSEKGGTEKKSEEKDKEKDESRE